ncbi:uncharacterized protein LOC143133545 [Alosa pseudoharengus]|uniref:uncharacterized protein LOC143133545 n=1 Tax=Alosa pseudoharengus TaxID=34774 RepID=UPI003F8B7618
MLLLVTAVFAACLGDGSSENVIAPNSMEVYPEDGSTVTLSCNISTKATSLQWYRQYPRSVPKHIVSVYNSDQTSDTDHRLIGKINTEKPQVFLQISSVQVSDSALYYCALAPTVTLNHRLPYKNLVRKNGWGNLFFKVVSVGKRSLPTALRCRQEKDPQLHSPAATLLPRVYSGTYTNLFTLDAPFLQCLFFHFYRYSSLFKKVLVLKTISSQIGWWDKEQRVTPFICPAITLDPVTVQWYRQHTSSAPEFLISETYDIIKSAEPPVSGLSMTHDKENKRVFLELSPATVSNAAVYYCALRPTVTGTPEALHKNQLVTQFKK